MRKDFWVGLPGVIGIKSTPGEGQTTPAHRESEY